MGVGTQMPAAFLLLCATEMYRNAPLRGRSQEKTLEFGAFLAN